MKDLDKQFRPGVDSGGNPSPGLDREAKYLYLYQTVNDRGTTLPIQSTSIRLLVDLKRKEITSWGYFSGRGFRDDAGLVDTNNSFGKDNVAWSTPAPANAPTSCTTMT